MSALAIAEVLAALFGVFGAAAGPMPHTVGVVHGVEWVSGARRETLQPRCLSDARAWSCWGIPAPDSGIVIVHGDGGIWWGLVTAGQSTDLRPAKWGRLIVFTGTRFDMSRLRMQFAYPILHTTTRMQAIRLATSRLAGAVGVPVGRNIVWTAGDAFPARAWVEIASETTAPVYIPLEEVAAAPASLAMHVAVRDRRVFEGRVVSADHKPAQGTLVSVFRLIDPPKVAGSRDLPRRVLIGEIIADDQGRFALPGVGEAEYELVAWHSQLGRASLPVSDHDSNITIRLQASGVARGRVLAGGHPAEGVDVISVPDTGTFSAAPDMTDVKGGDARTAPDGTFAVALSPSGGGELRIGGGEYPVRRIPLPRSPVPMFDVGNVELGQAIRISVVLDRDVSCGVRVAGPAGRTGLQIIAAVRTSSGAFDVALPEPGLWEFTLTCAEERRSLSPSVVQISSSHAGREVRMVVR